jgi:hypothetical protein
MQLEKRGRGRPATGPTTITIRVPIALKPAVLALVNTFHLAEQKAWETGPLRRQPDPGATGNRDSAACHETIGGNRDNAACHETGGRGNG